MNLRYLLAIVLLFCSSIVAFSQETIEEAKKRANELFQDEKYAEAMPVYLRLLADSPRDHNINYRYGTCLLYNPSKNQDVFKYLSYAVTSPDVEFEANYFLGRAYHLNYQFNDALKYYQIYQQKAGANAKPSLDVKRQIEMCNNGKKLITTITEMIVIDKKEIEKDKFFRIYDLSDIGGNLLVTAEFQTKLDEKKGHIPLIHFPANPTVIYYSSYGESGKTGKDIYVQRRLPTGGWGIPQMLQGGVNTNFDEDYPYMHPDGNYLYFSSKGHNSMGGYDVFRCKYDAETDMFGLAENMDFAVSSPNDDLFYVVDSLNRNAYFGSNRQSEEGKLNVYKVRVDRVPLNMTVIKGEFNSVITPTQKKVLIDVKDYASGEFIGNFNSNDKGFYLITFPKGGKYEMTIKVGDNPQEYKYIVSIPFQKEFKPLKQKIVHEMMSEVENVKVIDLFNEAVEDPQAVFAQVIRMKSELKPNADKFNLDELDKERKSKEVLNELGIGKLSLVEVGYLLEEEVKDAQKAENGTKDLENKLHTQVVNNAAELARLDAIIKSKMEKANAADTDKKKYRLLKEVERALKTQEEIKLQSEKSLAMADSLSKIAVTGSPAQTAQIKNISDQFNELMKENKQKEAYALLFDNKEALKKIISEKSPDPLQDLIERGLVLDAEIDRLQPKDDEFAQQIKKIEQEILTLENSKVTASKKEIEKIDAQIKSKKAEKQMVIEERSFNAVGLNEKIEERSAIRKQVDVLESLYALDTKKVITKDELASAVGTTNSINPAGTKNQVSGQINQLVLKDPSIKDVDYSDMAADLGPVATSTKNQADKVKSDPSLTPQQKAARLKDLDKQLLGSINNELAATKKALAANPNDPALRAKLDNLQNARAMVAASLDVPDEDNPDLLASNNSTSTTPDGTGQGNQGTTQGAGTTTPSATVSTPSSTELIEAANPSYNENIAKVNGNPALSESEKLTQLQQLDKELLSSIDKEIAKTEAAIKNSPNDATLAKKLEGLQDVKSDLQSDIAARETLLAGASDTAVKTPLMASPQPTAEEKATLIESVNSSYNEKVAQIKVNENLSASEKLNQLQQADKELLASIEEKIDATETASKQNPGNAALAKELADLKTIRNELESAISSRETSIANTTQSGADVKTPLIASQRDAIIESINPTYNDKVAQINSNSSLSETEKLTQLQQTDKALLASVEKEISTVESGLKSNPSDATLSKKLADLKAIETELESSIAARDNTLATASTSVVSSPLDVKEKEAVIEAVNPSYNEKIAQINSNSTLSEAEKLNQTQQEDKALLASVNKEISKVEAELKKNPSDTKLVDKLADLKTVKSELESAINNRESVIASAGQPLTQKEKTSIIDALNPSYNVKVAEINKNNKLTESQKLEQLQQVDKELITSLNKEIAALESNIKNNPDPQLTKELADYKSIKAELESKVAERETLLASGSSVKTPLMASPQGATLIESIAPTYNEKVAQINANSGLNETEKTNQLQQADRELLSTLNTEITKAEADLKKKPNDAVLAKKVADLKTVKSEIEAAIASRDSAIASSGGSTFSEKEKETLIESFNPTYNEKVAQINANTSLSEKEKLTQLQQADKELLTSLEKELSKVEADLKKNPNDVALAQKMTDLTVYKSELKSDIAERETSIADASSVKTPLMASRQSDSERTALIESVNSTYNEKVAQINNNTALSESQKLNQLQQADKELIAAIDKELANPAIDSKKATDLQVLKTGLESDVTARETVIASTHEALDPAVKAELIKGIDSKYDKKVAAVNNDKDLSTSEKLDKLQEIDYALIKEVNSEITKTETALAKNPSDEKLIKKSEDLQGLKTELETSVAARESVIASSGSTMDDKAKSELVESVSPSYNDKVAEVKNNEYMLDTEKQLQLQKLDQELVVAIDQEIASLQKELSDNPSNALAKRKVEQLNTLKTELEGTIAERQNSLSPSEASNPLAAKADLIEKLEAGYNERVAEIKADAFLTDLEKETQLQELDKELLVTINKELTKATKASKSKPKDEALKTAKQELAELKAIAEKVITEREEDLIAKKSASVTAQQKTELIEKVKPDYEAKVQQINDSNAEQSVKIQDLLKEENALLAKLEAEQKASQAAIKKAPRDEKLKEKDNVISVTKSETEKRINELTKEAVTLKATTIDQPALMAKVDPTFDTEIKQILDSNSPTKSADLAAREDKLQENITSKIEENEIQLASKYSLDLAAENQILAQKLRESNAREESYRGGSTKAPEATASTNPVTSPTSEKQAKIDALRKELLGDQASEVGKTYTDVEDLKRQEETLINYSDALSNRLQSVNDEIKASGSEPALVEEKALIESEIAANDSKVKRLATAIEQMEGVTSEAALTSPALKALIDKENEIKEKLNNPNLTTKEKSALEKELAQVKVEQKKEENNLMTADIAKRQATSQQKTSQLTQLGSTSEIAKNTTELATSQSSRLSSEASALVTQSEKEKDPTAKNEILTKAIEKQVEADAILEEALVDNATRAAINNQVTTLDSKEEIEQKIRKYTVEIGELEKQISDLDTEIAATKPKKAGELIKTRDALTAEKALAEKELADLERLRAEAEIAEIQKTIKPDAMDQMVSFEEEKKIVASEDYMKYSIDANAAVRLENRIAETEVMLTEQRNISKELIAMSLDKNSKISQADVKQSVENVKIAEDTLASLKEQLSAKQNALAAYNGDLQKMQNLVKRGVEPQFNLALAKVEENRAPLAGITIVEKPLNTYSDANPIPVNPKNPTGLVYRIQVGAFSKPIPQDMYKSFSPVTGEKLVSGVTRYMAGYFSKSAVVEDAHARVRSLGYSDAFIVAYCDDERISLAEAKRLEATGECINTSSQEFIIAMATKPETAPAVVDLAYNQAPGAVKATPAEAHLGLFYTVQVGVYNKPATAKQVKYIDPLVTKRLPNGQIRYSTGMFTSVAEATPKKAEARAKGVNDAFITAYYKGERITLSQASHLLRLNGPGILEKIDGSTLVSSTEGTTPTETTTPKETTPVVKVETPKGTSPEDVKASAYNKAPGAVPATAVETRLGLFFTVQIGVYSKPATMKQLNYVSPLITKKLPNGQIRYSTGMFTSIEAAEPKRKEALAKGVKHAYVTAYYKGERITIAEAKELLSANGDSILEKLDK